MNKSILLFFITAVMSVVLTISAKPVYSKIRKKEMSLKKFTETLGIAESMLLKGKRKAAVEQLDKIRPLVNSKKYLSRIDVKRKLFLEQFIKSEAFQSYQQAKGYALVNRSQECLQEIDNIDMFDQDNVLVLSLKAQCLRLSNQYENVVKVLSQIIAIVPTDQLAKFELAEVQIEQKKFIDALSILSAIHPTQSQEFERFAVLKAKVLVSLDRKQEAIEVLRSDQENYLEHVRVLFELGVLYGNAPGNDWLSRKYLSLFISRCKRMSPESLKQQKLDELMTQAQTLLSDVDKRLQI